MLVVLCAIIALTCIFTADFPYDRLRRRNKARDSQRVVEAFRVAYDKETELRLQRENELVRRQVILECHKQQKVQLNAIRERQKESLKALQDEIDQKKQELETCKSNFNQELQNARKESEQGIGNLNQDIAQKEQNIVTLESQISETENSYNRQIEELKAQQEQEMEQFKQKTINELRTDEFDLYKKVTVALEESRKKLLQENSERVKTVTTYAAMELVQFGFPTKCYAFIQSKVCTLAETGGKFDKTEPSPIKNPFKDIDARKRGRRRKVNTGELILTTQDIAHYTRNIALYLDFRLEDVARFTEYLFKDWFSDGDFMSIAKAAAKSPDSGLIKIHEDLEAYLVEQGWM